MSRRSLAIALALCYITIPLPATRQPRRYAMLQDIRHASFTQNLYRRRVNTAAGWRLLSTARILEDADISKENSVKVVQNYYASKHIPNL